MSRDLKIYFSVSASGTEEMVAISPSGSHMAICLVGATFQTQVPTLDWTTQLNFHIPRSYDCPGHFIVIGLCQRSQEFNGVVEHITYHTIPVYWKNDKAAVHLEDVYMPPAERMIHVTSDGSIEVAIDDQIYSSHLYPQLLSGRCCGVNPNHLCRYVAGLIPAETIQLEYGDILRAREEKASREATAQKAAKIPWDDVARTVKREWQERRWGWRGRIKAALAKLP